MTLGSFKLSSEYTPCDCLCCTLTINFKFPTYISRQNNLSVYLKLAQGLKAGPRAWTSIGRGHVNELKKPFCGRWCQRTAACELMRPSTNIQTCGVRCKVRHCMCRRQRVVIGDQPRSKGELVLICTSHNISIPLSSTFSTTTTTLKMSAIIRSQASRVIAGASALRTPVARALVCLMSPSSSTR